VRPLRTGTLHALLLLAGCLAAAGRQQEPAVSQVPVIEDVIDVRVVNVEAVVVDGDRKPVRGLTAADFRLLVDGKEVPIDYFTEIAEGRAAAAPAGPEAPLAPMAPMAPIPPAETVGRSYLVFIDDSFAVAEPRNAVLERLAADLAQLGPEDQMAVLAFDGRRIEVLSGWTADRSALAAALGVARQRLAAGNQRIAQNRSMGEDVDVALEAVSLQYSREEMADLMATLDQRVSPEARSQLGKTAAAMTGALRGFELPAGRKLLLLLSGGWSLQVAPRLFGPLVESANRLGYTVYPVDAAQGDARVLKALDRMAAATGGRVANTASGEILKVVAEDSGTYYWLGFSPAWKANDEIHRITVEVRRKGLTVRARDGFSDLSRRTETAIKAESVLLFGGEGEDRRLRIELGEPKPVGRRGARLRVPVTLGVPVEALALSPADKGGFVAEVPLAIAAVDAEGGRAELPTSRLRVTVPEAPPAGGYARFRTAVDLRKGPQRLVFTVRDAASGRILWGEATLAP
jgi:VWFA-related protein